VSAGFSGGVELYDPDEGGATLPRHMSEPSMAGSGEEFFLERATLERATLGDLNTKTFIFTPKCLASLFSFASHFSHPPTNV